MHALLNQTGRLPNDDGWKKCGQFQPKFMRNEHKSWSQAVSLCEEVINLWLGKWSRGSSWWNRWDSTPRRGSFLPLPLQFSSTCENLIRRFGGTSRAEWVHMLWQWGFTERASLREGRKLLTFTSPPSANGSPFCYHKYHLGSYWQVSQSLRTDANFQTKDVVQTY